MMFAKGILKHCRECNYDNFSRAQTPCCLHETIEDIGNIMIGAPKLLPFPVSPIIAHPLYFWV